MTAAETPRVERGTALALMIDGGSASIAVVTGMPLDPSSAERVYVAMRDHCRDSFGRRLSVVTADWSRDGAAPCLVGATGIRRPTVADLVALGVLDAPEPEPEMAALREADDLLRMIQTRGLAIYPPSSGDPWIVDDGPAVGFWDGETLLHVLRRVKADAPTGGPTA